jgi:chemotaxis protein CheX
MSADIVLPPRLDLPAAAPLADAILGKSGQDLRIDADRVQFLGGLCLQVLLAARIQWLGDGKSLTLSRHSAEFDAALGLFGLALQDLQTGAA